MDVNSARKTKRKYSKFTNGGIRGWAIKTLDTYTVRHVIRGWATKSLKYLEIIRLVQGDKSRDVRNAFTTMTRYEILHLWILNKKKRKS